MGTKLLKFVCAILILLPVCAFATDKTFTSSGSIVDGDVFGTVYVQNNGTLVNMSGGHIGTSSLGGLYMNDSSIFNMSGGLIENTISTLGSSSFNLSDGTIESEFDFGGTVSLSGGSITGGGKFKPGSIVNIDGGNLNFSDAVLLYGELNIYGGLLNFDDFSDNGGVTNIYGYGFNYDPVGQVLTGYLSDHNQFTINQLSSYEYQRLNLIPEPISFLFFGFGLLALRKQK
ncbi:MAG: hypothetical protein WC770_07295 [Phycisphaerae bacterium]